MPAVLIRLLTSLAYVAEGTKSAWQRSVLARQADMVLACAERSVLEPNDVAFIRARYEDFATLVATLDGT
jgi:uncharacterized membrane protein